MAIYERLPVCLKRTAGILLAGVVLAACGVRGDDVAFHDTPPEGFAQLNRGIPVLLGASAAAVQFTDGVGVTVAHNRVVIRDRLWFHPTHDIAFFVLDEPVPQWSEASVGTPVIAFGNSRTRQNRILETEIVTTEGAFWYVPDDAVYITELGFTSGMSGGPVFNEQGEAIGIVLGTVVRDPPEDHDMYGKLNRRNGIIVPSSQIKIAFMEMCADLDWMKPCDIEARPGGHDKY